MKRIEQHYQRLIRDLNDFSKEYEDGRWSRAYQLCTTIYQLVYHGGKNTAVANSLGLLRGENFPNPQRGWVNFGFPTLKISLSATPAQNRFGAVGVVNSDSRVNFQTWWKKTPIINLHGQLKLSRMDFIRTMRNQDGGGHVDQNIKDRNYEMLLLGAFPNIRYFITTRGIRFEVQMPQGNVGSLHVLSQKPHMLEMSPSDISGPHEFKDIELEICYQIALELLSVLKPLKT